MPAVLADLRIEARWILPMTSPGVCLEEHSLIVRDGRILDVLPTAAAGRYAATVVLQRPAHALIPGLIDAHTRVATTLFRRLGAAAGRARGDDAIGAIGTELARDGTLSAVADMIKSGITCFGDRCLFPEATARAATEQGMRAVIGLPVAETPGPWAANSADYLTRALAVRDEYRGHPLISTAFAPQPPHELSDATFERIATLADELDTGILIDLHSSAAEISHCLAAHGTRPLQRLWRLGLLTPALNAARMSHTQDTDLELARRTGISITLCPQSSLARDGALPDTASLLASGIPLGLGSGGAHPDLDMWGEIKLLALMAAGGPAAETAQQGAWIALVAGTRGSAAALGIDAEVGSLDTGRWADVCCLDMSGPATHPTGDVATQLVFGGGRDIVRDVWVAGRQLLSEGMLTRLDWPAVAARAGAWARRLSMGA